MLVDEAPIVDGKLDDLVWEKVDVITDPTQVEPRMGAPRAFGPRSATSSTANLFTDRDDVPETAGFDISPICVTSQVEDLFEVKPVDLYDAVRRPFYLTRPIGVVPREYHGYSGVGDLTTSLHRPLRVRFTTSVGTFYEGWGVRIAPLVEWRPSRHWLLAIDCDGRPLFDFDACKGSTIGTPNCNRAANEPYWRHTNFATRLARLRIQIAFNTEIAWSMLVQYDNISRGLPAQSRLRWTFRC